MRPRMYAILAAAALVVAAATTAHAISFIESPSATCRKIKGNQCAIRWYYMSVSATSGQYIVSLRLLLGDKVVFHSAGFFQTSLYIPHDMIGDVAVPCGKAGTTPDPVPVPTPGGPGPYAYGNAYAYTIQARETGGLKSANYGTVYCPAK